MGGESIGRQCAGKAFLKMLFLPLGAEGKRINAEG